METAVTPFFLILFKCLFSLLWPRSLLQGQPRTEHPSVTRCTPGVHCGQQYVAGRRQVVVHNDFKPDNILYNPETRELTVIDYDLVQVGAAVMDFGLPYMMWLGSRFTNYQYRKNFIKFYLEYSSSEG